MGQNWLIFPTELQLVLDLKIPIPVIIKLCFWFKLISSVISKFKNINVQTWRKMFAELTDIFRSEFTDATNPGALGACSHYKKHVSQASSVIWAGSRQLRCVWDTNTRTTWSYYRLKYMYPFFFICVAFSDVLTPLPPIHCRMAFICSFDSTPISGDLISKRWF